MPDEDIRHLHVHVSAHVDGQPEWDLDLDEEIPPDYDNVDIQALARRRVEDTAFDLNDQYLGGARARRVLRAHTARLRAIEDLLSRMPRTGPVAQFTERLQALFDLTNDEVTEEWGEEPDE